jgi:hypothetical protein
MTIVEAGIIAGIPVGAVIGTVIGRTHGTTGLVGGILGGLVAGIVFGWIYALFEIALLSVVGVLWRAARGKNNAAPTISELAFMSPIAATGTFVGVLAALFAWLSSGAFWAVIVASAIALLTAIVTIARNESR